MENILKELVDTLTTTVFPEDIFSKIINLLPKSNVDISSKFIVENLCSLRTLKQWAWKMLSDDPSQWIDKTEHFSFLEVLAVFNKNLIFTSEQIDADTKASLLLPESNDITQKIFDRIEKNDEGNDRYFRLISLWIDNLSYCLQEQTQFVQSPIIIDINRSVALKFVMTDRYQSYLIELQQPQVTLTNKQLFFLKTCSFSLSSYFFCKKQTFPFSGEEILQFLGKDYIELIRIHSVNVQSWSRELLACITHLTHFLYTCCWWRGDPDKRMKILFTSLEISRAHIQSLIQIINYQPFHQQIQPHRSNEETILIQSILGFIFRILINHELNYFLRIRTRLVETLLLLAETSGNNLISICAYASLGEVLSEESLKELKITDQLCGYFFYILEHAWKHPAQMFHRSSIQQILRGFQTLAKYDSIQQTTANGNKIPLLVEMCEQYPGVYDILWALSFNKNIQEQLRSDSKFMFNISHLNEDTNNGQMRKTVHGILWNLEFDHDDHTVTEHGKEPIFDIMISYSHNDKVPCRQIYDELIKAGYRVWIDFDQMHGNVMDAMAQAIEQSETILICMSEQYRRSNYCRAEAHYAFQRQLKIVPVLLQEHYKPDGWLLFLVGQLLYVNFVENDFQQAIQMLFKELRTSTMKEDVILPTESEHEMQVISTSLPLPLPLPRATAPVFSKNIIDWTQQEAQEWLKGHNLVQMSHLLSDYDGASLVYLNRYLANAEAEQIVKLLENDSIRQTNQNLSLVELPRLQSLIEKEQKQTVHSKETERISTKTRILCSRFCQIL